MAKKGAVSDAVYKGDPALYIARLLGMPKIKHREWKDAKKRMKDIAGHFTKKVNDGS